MARTEVSGLTVECSSEACHEVSTARDGIGRERHVPEHTAPGESEIKAIGMRHQRKRKKKHMQASSL